MERNSIFITPRKAVGMLMDKMEQYADFGFGFMSTACGPAFLRVRTRVL